ncbi:uncharacterized protein I303_100734 [Kwoniella dejecticola CBS 10117]|uniref:Xylanolytic transcriptional activator regulatory domain-containing protein n=1 Tax=Kwoniella dejecticola CBS 10117 TaxID=1296121 RepID=A0A1A6AFU2_9TREE|nr:uncharacterized protein I303_00737 [Kwoniella dejecticola CBS 10117]OBR88919.1 hypothetical protein I303_00737 [Kwoniella dejecticola CBS 10117]
MPPRTKVRNSINDSQETRLSSPRDSTERSHTDEIDPLVQDAAQGDEPGMTTSSHGLERSNMLGSISPTHKRKGKCRSILAMFNETDIIDEELDETEEWHQSLDLETTDLEESHFLGSSAIQDLTILTELPEGPSSTASSSTRNASAFRQVSKDPRKHVFFVRNPAFVYGKGSIASQTIFQKVCGILGSGWPEVLVQKFLTISLPAFPIINTMRLLAACNSNLGADPLPHALLCGIIGHSIEYESSVKHLFKDVWKEVVAAEDEEYKQPRLRTLQLAIISLATRPSSAHAVNAMSLARSVSIAHMIGLHLDCSGWRLPRWERSVRKRVWWALFILDEWISIVHGRPSLITKSNRSVTLPTIDDTDWGEFSSSSRPEEDIEIERSMASFIGQCEIALIIEEMLEKFYSQEAQRRSTGISQDDLRDLSAKMDALQARTPEYLIWKEEDKLDKPLATGIRCFQMTFLGVRVLIARLYVTSHHDQQNIRAAELQAIEIGLSICEEFVHFLQELSPELDYNTFWLPHCSFLISTCLGLLLRICVRLHTQRANISTPTNLKRALEQYSVSAISLVRDLSNNLKTAKNTHKWELAETALIRGNELLRTTSSLIPELQDLAEPLPDVGQASNNDFNFDFTGFTGFSGMTDSFGTDWSWALNLGDLNTDESFMPDDAAVAMSN